MEGRPPFDDDDELDFDFDSPRRRHSERAEETSERHRRPAEPPPVEPEEEPPSREYESPHPPFEDPGREYESDPHGADPYEEPSSSTLRRQRDPDTFGGGEPYEDPFDTEERRARREGRQHSRHRDLPAKVRRRQAIAAGTIALVVIGGAFLLLRGGGGDGDEEPGITPKRLLGQSFVGRLPADGPSPALIKSAKKGQLGGIIVTDQISDEAVIQTAISRLQDAASAGDNPPLLVMVDQEGGQVRRLPGPPNISPADLGASGDAEAAKTAGEETGTYLRPLGITVDLAPVLDVTLTRTADTIAARTFGEDAAVVSELGSSFIEGIQSQQVAATAKHFPGLGLATLNTDDSPVSVVGRQEELDAALEPFRAAVTAGVQLVMMSNAAYPSYAGPTPNKGRVKPASFAEPIVGGLLRGDLGFEGVVITDDLQSVAIETLTSGGTAAVSALGAGCDMVMYARSERGLSQGFTAAVKALKKGTLESAAIQQSYDRITALKEALAAS